MSFDDQIIVNFPQHNKTIRQTPYGEGLSVNINGTITQAILIGGNYLSGDISYNNNDTLLFGSFNNSGISIIEFPECHIINEPFPKGDTLYLECNPGGSATFTYQFSDIIII